MTAAPADTFFPPVHAMDADHEGFSLLRLVLIDSLSPGRIVELPLTGGAVLTGRNGRGKTSLLQLLLLFYGESPNRIVTAEAGRDSFTGYYLPRTTSYLAFEYQRHGGHKRMVVAYADRAGERVLYRFIRGGFDVKQFIRSDGEFVQMQDFRRHLATQGFVGSDIQIESQSDYRTIIQGIASHAANKEHQRHLRALTQDYAFTGTRQPLRQIEKIVSGMFRRKTNFDDLQSMVIDCVSDESESASRAISGDRSKIESWPRDYKAYAAVMALEPRMQAAERDEGQLQAAEMALGSIGAKYRSLLAHLDQQADQAARGIHQRQAQAQEEQEALQQRRHAITAEQVTAQSQAELAQDQADKLQRQAAAYEREGIEALDRRVRHAQALRSELQRLEERRRALLGEQSDIAGRYERLKQIEKEAFNDFRDSHQARRTQAAQTCESDLATLDKALETAEIQAREAASIQRAPLDEAVQAANTEHGRCLHGVDHPAPDASASALVERKHEALEEARQGEAAAQAQHRILEDAYRKARLAAEKACQAHQPLLQKASSQTQAAAAELQEAKRQLQASRQQALALAKQRLEQATQAQAQARQALARFDEATSTEAQRVRTLYGQKRRERQQQRDAEFALMDAALTSQQAELARKLAGYDSERDGALRDKGVDPAQLAAIDREIAQIAQELSAIPGFIQRVQAWRYWKEHQWPELEKHLNEAERARQALAQCNAALSQLTRQWDERSQQLQEDLRQQRLALEGILAQRKLVQTRLEGLQGYPDVCVGDHDPSWTFDALSGQANQYLQEVSRLGHSIRRAIVDITAGFRLHQGTPPEQYLQSALAPLSPAPSREWLAPLQLWFATAHHECRRILLMQAVSIASEVSAFHRTMEEFHRRVQQFNRELQDHLDTSLAFESISKISVEVVSTIKELQYWPTICELTESHRAWSASSATALPPAEFAQTIERLLEHWEVKTGIRADLRSLIRIQGEVTENGNRRVFKRASDLEAVSSNGLSYLVLATIFVAFINRIRRSARVNIIWALDELKDLDGGNIVALIELLERNNITLVCAFPDPDPDTMALFRHRFTVEADRRLAEVRVAFDDLGEPGSEAALDTLELNHV